jgi:uncharacterized membrane protein YphA (DoxX/SURF4 family)
MSNHPTSLAKAIAVARIATGVLFLLFGEYKVAGPEFAHTGFSQYLQGYIQGAAFACYRPFLAHVVLPHVVFFGYFVGILELLIGIALVVGLWVRAASVMGALFLFNLLFATWWEPGHGVPVWRYFGAELDKLPLILLFLIFYAADAGAMWGVDGYWRRPV